MVEQNNNELEKKIEEPLTGWRGLLLGEKAAAEPEKEPLPTGWRSFIEKERREE